MRTEENWKDIYGYNGLYQVSDYGNIKSIGRYIRSARYGVRWINEKILKPSKTNGYYRVQLSRTGKQVNKLIHRCVAEAFIFNQDDKIQVNHKNGIKTDNRVENLEWCTSSENIQHSYDIGTRTKKGTNHHHCQLEEDHVIQIRGLVEQGFKSKRIQEMYDISAGHLYNIKNNKIWKHI